MVREYLIKVQYEFLASVQAYHFFLALALGIEKKMRIEKIICIDKLTLLIYYTKAKCWQFAVIGEDAKLWQSHQIFY